MKYCSGSRANRSGGGPLMPGILARYRRRVPRRMDDAEWRAFVSEGTRTGKLATVRADGRPHVVPIWFVLDGDDLVFTTGAHRSRPATGGARPASRCAWTRNVRRTAT